MCLRAAGKEEEGGGVIIFDLLNKLLQNRSGGKIIGERAIVCQCFDINLLY